MNRALAGLLTVLWVATATVLAAPTAAFDAIVGTTGSFSGQLKSNSANAFTTHTSYWSGTGAMWVQNQSATVLRFKTGAASTLTNLEVDTYFFQNGGAGTASFSVTTTAGVALCTISYSCGVSTPSQNVQSCSSALSANTEYQFRHVGCSTSIPAFFYNMVATVTTP